MRLVWWTGRWEAVGQPFADELFQRDDPLIVVFWHGRMFMMPFGSRFREKVHVLISGHWDGRLIARTMSHFRIPTVTGSTRRGGAEAILRLRRIIRHGGVACVTPDGPRGPRMRASEGVIHLARLTGATIMPISFAARPRRVFSSWDRFVLPLPFCKGLFLWGEPIVVPSDADDATIEAKRRAVEDSLNDLTHRADARMGLPKIDPDAARASRQAS